MTGEAAVPPATEAPEPRPPAEKRPWWVPLLGVGSMGIGGMQAVGGGMILVAAMQVEGEGARHFLVAALAWILPGAMLAVGGIGITTGARWARALSLAAVAAGILGGLAVFSVRTKLPSALADFIETAGGKGGAAEGLSRTLADLRKGPNGDPVLMLRDPGQAEFQGNVYAGYCCCPALPWQVLLVVVCATPLGKRLNG